MTHYYYTLTSNIPLIIIPDITSHMDGHPVLSYTHNLFLNTDDGDGKKVFEKENIVSDKHDDPDYYGKITFESPGQLFTYEDGNHVLTRSEVEEVIEHISHVRDNPNLWKTENL
jgi:hypothetical protein